MKKTLENNFEKELKVAIEAAVSSGNILIENFGKLNVLTQKESMRDIVTPIDYESENNIIQIIQNFDNKIGILCEENGVINELKDSYWVIDALDGTVNFLNNIPFFSISVAYIHKNQPVVGVIYNPVFENLYYGTVFLGGFKNNSKIFPIEKEINEVLTAAAFSGKIYKNRNRSDEFTLFGKINDISQGTLRTGSAALNIAYVSEGRLGACWGKANKLWDIAGGLAIAKSSGCEVDFRIINEQFFLVDYFISNKKSAKKIKEITKEILDLN